MAGVKRFLTDTIIYGLTTIVSRLLNFLLTPIFIGRLKGASAYGVFTNMYASVSMVNAVLAFGMETTFFRYLQKVEPKDKGKVYDQAFFITLCTTFLLAISVYFGQSQIAGWFSGEPSNVDYQMYVQLLAGTLIADALAVVPFAKLRAESRPIRYAAIKVFNIVVTIGVNLVFLFLFPKWMLESTFWQHALEGWFKPDWVLGNIFLSNFIASASTLVLLLPQLLSLRFRLDKALIRSMLLYSFPILVANISFIVNEHLDKMILPSLLPEEIGDRDLGIYGAVSKLAVFIALFVTAFRLGAEPFFFSYAKNENAKKTYADIMLYFVLFMVVGALGICANLEWLKYYINKPDDPIQQALYWSGLTIVPVLLFNNVLLGIYMNLSIWYKLTDQTRYGLYISVIGAIITVVLNLLLIPHYSYVGAAISTTIAYLSMVSLSYFWGQKNYPVPYQSLKIVGYLLSAVVVAYIMQQVLDNHFWWCNLLLIAYTLLIVWMERPAILMVIRRLKPKAS